MNLRTVLVFGLSFLTLLGGCAPPERFALPLTSRSELAISPPAMHTRARTTNKEVYIEEAIDRREFETNPRTPNTPSLSPNETQSDSIKARAIARKRHNYGKALGDILLKDGQTVEELMTNTIRRTFIEKGYRIVNRREDVRPDTLIVEADVNKFWSWMDAGFVHTTLTTEISTDLTLRTDTQNRTVTISIRTSGEYARKGWVDVIDRALRAYVDDLKAKLE